MAVQWLCELDEARVTTPEACLACLRSGAACPLVPGLVKALARSMEDDPVLDTLVGLGMPVVRVSDLIGCPRRGWYRRQYPVHEKPSRLWSRLRGSIFHRGLEDGSEGSETRVAAVVHAPLTKVVVTGRVDHYDANTRTLVDYKTINGRGRDLDLPLPHHAAQMRLYAWLLRAAREWTVERIRLVYVFMSHFETVDVEPPNEDELRTLERHVTVKAAQVVAKDPPAPAPRESWECRYCPYRDECPGVEGG